MVTETLYVITVYPYKHLNFPIMPKIGSEWGPPHLS